MTITFANTGVYTYDKLRVVSQPVQGIEEKTVKLGEEALENVKMGTNEITGDISVSERKLLCCLFRTVRDLRLMWTGKKRSFRRRIPCLWLWNWNLVHMRYALHIAHLI